MIVLVVNGFFDYLEEDERVGRFGGIVVLEVLCR